LWIPTTPGKDWAKAACNLNSQYMNVLSGLAMDEAGTSRGSQSNVPGAIHGGTP